MIRYCLKSASLTFIKVKNTFILSGRPVREVDLDELVAQPFSFKFCFQVFGGLRCLELLIALAAFVGLPLLDYSC